MSRQEFMERLEKLLGSISDSEREEALQYYNDYFDDAGPENEAKVIEELGSPDQVAHKIRAGFSEADSEYSERGYEDARFRDSQEIMSREQKEKARDAGNTADGHAADRNGQPEVKKTGGGWKILAIILLCILAAPVIIPLGIAALAVLVGVIVAVAAICFGIVVAGIAILVAGLVVIGVGLVKVVAAPAIGLAVSGVGLLMFALGILLSLAILWCGIKVVPWLIRGIVGLLSYPFRKAGAEK